MSQSQQFCTFFLDELFFGVEVQKVQEVIRYQHMTRVPRAAKCAQRADQSARADRHGHRSARAVGAAPTASRISCP